MKLLRRFHRFLLTFTKQEQDSENHYNKFTGYKPAVLSKLEAASVSQPRTFVPKPLTQAGFARSSNDQRLVLPVQT